MEWSYRLSRQIKLRDGRVLRTLEDARALLLGLSDAAQRHPWNEHAAGLLMKAAETGRRRDIADATAQMQSALSREGLTA